MKTDVPPGTLAMLILRTIARIGPMHGYGIAQYIAQVSQDVLQLLDAHATLHNTLELITTHIERSDVHLQIALDEAEPAFVLAAPGHLEDVWLGSHTP